MPTAPPRPCPRCRRTLVRGRGPCARCASLVERRRGSAHARGYDAAWERLRAAHLVEHPWCACKDLTNGHGRYITDGCGERATDVDHIQTVQDAPHRRLDPTNLRSYAHACHSRKTATVDGGFGRC